MKNMERRPIGAARERSVRRLEIGGYEVQERESGRRETGNDRYQTKPSKCILATDNSSSVCTIGDINRLSFKMHTRACGRVMGYYNTPQSTISSKTRKSEQKTVNADDVATNPKTATMWS